MIGGEGRARFVSAFRSQSLAIAVASGVAVGYAALLAMSFYAHIWILDADGRPLVEDFAAFWSAGHLVLARAASAPYDLHLQHAAEVRAIGHPFATPLGWSYPPVFLFAAAALASLPYVTAYLWWCAATLTLQGSVITAIARRGWAFVLACAAPWTLLGLMPGQNGFLTAGLIGLALLFLEHRPIASGFFLGLLSYKPQFGILFPFALAAGGYWRAFAAAAFSTLASNGAAAALFGGGTIAAFVHSMTLTTQSHLIVSGIGWNKLQSFYGLARASGLGGGWAWTAQFAAIAVIMSGVCVVWHSRLPYSLKAALLAAAVPLATPYVFVYDLPMLGVAIAFLFRHRAFDGWERAWLASTVPSMFAFLWLPIPSALFAGLAVAAIAARRCYEAAPRMRISPSWATDATSLPSAE